MASIQQFIKKFLLALAPLGWGFFTWFLAWGPGEWLIPYTKYPLGLIIRTTLGFGLCILFFARVYEQRRKTYIPTFFEYSFNVPPWWLYVLAVYGALALSFFFIPLYEYPIAQSLITGVLLYPCIEELIGHTLFIKYSLSGIEVIVFGTVNAFAWALMHRWYENPLVPIEHLWQRGYIEFGLMMALVAYKTKRIEIPLALHMLSNLLGYTLPVIILKRPVVPLYHTILQSFFIFCVAALAYRKKNEYAKEV